MQLNHLIVSHFVKLYTVHQHWLVYIRARYIALPLSDGIIYFILNRTVKIKSAAKSANFVARKENGLF